MVPKSSGLRRQNSQHLSKSAHVSAIIVNGRVSYCQTTETDIFNTFRHNMPKQGPLLILDQHVKAEFFFQYFLLYFRYKIMSIIKSIFELCKDSFILNKIRNKKCVISTRLWVLDCLFTRFHVT